MTQSITLDWEEMIMRKAIYAHRTITLKDPRIIPADIGNNSIDEEWEHHWDGLLKLFPRPCHCPKSISH